MCFTPPVAPSRHKICKSLPRPGFHEVETLLYQEGVLLYCVDVGHTPRDKCQASLSNIHSLLSPNSCPEL